MSTYLEMFTLLSMKLYIVASHYNRPDDAILIDDTI